MNSEEIVWEMLLSREPYKVRSVFRALDEETRAAVLAHLHAMSSEEGWHPEQVKSAEAALEIIARLEISQKKIKRQVDNRKGKE
jgi:hypothetical protein